MNEQTAEPVDSLDAFVNEALEKDSESLQEVDNAAESAPAEKEEIAAEPAAEVSKNTENGVQKRINKITADKYAEKRRADDLQAELDALKRTPADELKKPSLEEHDHDEEAFNQANLEYQVQQQLVKRDQAREQEILKQRSEQVRTSFNDRVNALGKEDFDEKVSALPDLPPGVVDALMQSENGADLVYHLGEHLDKADALSQMTPAAAMMELGRLSVEMNKKPEIKTSAAPDPIEPIKSRSSMSADIGDEMSMDAWMAKYG